MKATLIRSLRTASRGYGAAVRRAAKVPPVRKLRELLHEQAFAHDQGGYFFGIYDTFADAAEAAPKTKPVGFAEDGPGTLYRNRLDRVFPSDYPVIFWMNRFLEPGSRVFDLGGHVGIAYFAYERYLRYGEPMRWTVYDMPTVVKAGEELARERAARHLSFTTRLEDCDHSDILLVSGSLQFMDSPGLAELLIGLEKKPRVVIVNRTPLSDGEAFVTLHNFRVAICPYRVLNEKAFMQSMTEAGYRVLDRWDCPEHRCELPLHPERSLSSYRGICFERV